MTSGKRQKLICLMMMFVCLGWWGQVRAYVLCPDHILTLMLEETGRDTGLAVRQQTGLRDMDCGGQVDEERPLLVETIWYEPPGHFRAEVTGEEGQRIYVSTGQGALSIAGEKIVANRRNELLAYHLPLAFEDHGDLTERLEQYGVDPTVSSLGRHQDAVAFVIGARYPDLSRSQLWVDKESFLPRRFIIRTAADDSLLEARYLDWRKANDLWYPWRIEIYRDGLVERVICALSVRRQSSFADTFFDLTELKAAYPEDVPENDPAGAPAQGKPEQPYPDNDVQQTIDDFRKLYQ
ncbi:MAG: hypothetical protein R6U29_03250 [Desulfosudaceae bacterium]